MSLEQDQPKNSRRKLDPADYYRWVILIGVLAGIGHYWLTGNTLLLFTFLGLMGGKAIGQYQPTRHPTQQ